MADFARATNSSCGTSLPHPAHGPGASHDPRRPAVPAEATYIRFVPAANLTEADVARWNAVADDSADANVFARPWMVLPALAALDGQGRAVIAMAFAPDDRLIGVLPVTLGHLAGRIHVSAVHDWTHANAFSCALTIRRGEETAFWLGLLAALAKFAPRVRAIGLSGIAADSAAMTGLLAATRHTRTPLAIDRRTVRAMLSTSLSAEAYWQASVRAKKRKELRRQWNRLNEMGTVTLDQLAPDGDAGPWIGEFLELEAAGWKGAARSALSSHQGTEAFFRQAITAAHARNALSFSALRIGGRAAAMLIVLTDANAGFAFKTAYDETLAHLSPGVLIQREALGLLTARNLRWIDSCAAQHHPMIDSLWRERREILDLSLPMPGLTNRLTFAATKRATTLWHKTKAIGSALRRAAANPRESRT